MDRLNNAIRLIESVSFLAVCIAFLIKDNLDICYIMASLGILGFIALIVLILIRLFRYKIVYTSETSILESTQNTLFMLLFCICYFLQGDIMLPILLGGLSIVGLLIRTWQCNKR